MVATDRANRPALTFALLICSTVIGLAGTDLVLPAVPLLPQFLSGTIEEAQLVLAAFAAGSKPRLPLNSMEAAGPLPSNDVTP